MSGQIKARSRDFQEYRIGEESHESACFLICTSPFIFFWFFITLGILQQLSSVIVDQTLSQETRNIFFPLFQLMPDYLLEEHPPSRTSGSISRHSEISFVLVLLATSTIHLV
jgi:hypothetical protein